MFVGAFTLAALISHVTGNIITPSQLAPSYDFIIAGGGVGGLVLASRLSEDANKTVLVLEAGDTGDAVKSSIGMFVRPRAFASPAHAWLDIPANAYYSSLLGKSYDWSYKTVAQSGMNNREVTWPRGKVLGGSSAINGMYLVRPSKVEMDANAGLMANEPAAAAWTWDSFFEAMKKVRIYYFISGVHVFSNSAVVGNIHPTNTRNPGSSRHPVQSCLSWNERSPTLCLSWLVCFFFALIT